ncbi:MAG: hypothetical protein QF780_07600 [Candidatus Marinimicrobia bacterium]|jgi:hypothetical protein|nr:hypothetical protein [Candidatus Neomarinimicrobiota bacterium]|tara:strand:+ start:8405 stop:8617 length:213 start_codon:yes stop_codon:yes gene_type:complete
MIQKLKITIGLLLLGSASAQLQVGDISPDFGATICMNGEDVNPDFVTGDYWSLYEEGYGKVTWINLFTSW